MKLVKAPLIILIFGILSMASLALNTQGTFAATSVVWTGNGSEHLPCANGAHWILSPAQGIISATLIVNGNQYTMTQSGNGSFSADSSGSIAGGLTASATYEDDNDKAFLKLSHCLDESTQTPTQTSTPTSTNTPTSTSTPTETSTPTQTSTPTGTLTPTETPTETSTPTQTSTPTGTLTPTETPEDPSTSTPTPTETDTPTVSISTPLPPGTGSGFAGPSGATDMKFILAGLLILALSGLLLGQWSLRG